MSTTQHDHLHRLIRSLDRAEKRYFKVYTSRHLLVGHSNHHVLFDAIDAQEEYDEAALLRMFAKEAFTNRFAITKRRLYETVLRCLDAYHAESSIDARLRRSLHHVEILYRRALYPESEKMLHSVRKSAEQHGRHAVLFAVREWECRFLEHANYTAATTEALEARRSEGEALRNATAQADALWQLKTQAFQRIYRHGQARDQRDIHALKELLRSPLLSEPGILSSVRAKYLYHHIHSAVAFATSDLRLSREHLLQNRALIEKEYAHFEQEPNLLLGVLGNLVFITAQLDEHSEALVLLKEFRRAPEVHRMPESPDLEVKLFATSYSLELGLLCRAGDFGKAAELLPVIERGLSRHADSIGMVRKAGFLYQMAYSAFGNGDMESALRHTHKLLNEVSIERTDDAICYGRLLHLILLLETGRTDQLHYAVRNTTRFLQTRNRSHRTEQLLIRLLQSLGRHSSGPRARKRLQEFHDQLVSMGTDPLERALYDHLDPLAWATSKLTGKPFAEVVKERLSAQLAAA